MFWSSVSVGIERVGVLVEHGDAAIEAADRCPLRAGDRR
jgi:hypothetical protein